MARLPAYEDPDEEVVPRPGLIPLRVLQECRPIPRKGRAGDHGFFFSPAMIASGVIGIGRAHADRIGDGVGHTAGPTRVDAGSPIYIEKIFLTNLTDQSVLYDYERCDDPTHGPVRRTHPPA
jgi:hypothetical protein